jgi:hypothetical protein
MSRRNEHIAKVVNWAWTNLGVNLMPQGETAFVIFLWALLEEAVEEEVQLLPSMYERLQKVSVN